MIRRLASSALLLAAACGSVQLPAERFFGLTVAAPISEGAPVVGLLRVHDLQPSGAIDRDYPTFATGVELAHDEYDRWIAPLERLVTDAVVLGLSRRRVAELVVGAADSGAEQWALHGRILEFAAMRDEAGNFAHVTLELWLLAGDRLLLRDEFRAIEPIGEGGTAAAVAGLSRGLADIVGQVEQRLRALPSPADGRPASPAR